MAHRRTDEPRFLWTGLLILLPVLALAVVGWMLIAKFRHDALDTLNGEAESHLRDWVEAGEALLHTSEYGAGHWALLSLDGEVISNDPDQSRPVYSDPPRPPAEPFPQALELMRLLDDVTIPPEDKAIAARKLSGGRTASGLPVSPLADRLALREGVKAGWDEKKLAPWAESLCEAVCAAPSLLDQTLLDEAFEHLNPERKAFWTERWEADRPFREFYAKHWAEIMEMVDQSKSGDVYSIYKLVTRVLRSPEGELEAVCSIGASPLYRNLHAVPADQIDDVIKERIVHTLPEYLGARIFLAGEFVFGLRTGADDFRGMPERLLGQASDEEYRVRAEVVLADEALFESLVDQRTRPIAWLIGLAAFAALVGWFAAWRAFVKQQRLAVMKDNFVSAVSHELKAPVAAIGLMAEEMGRGDDKREEYAGLIAGECARLGSLVENVLDYARIESGREGFEFEEVDVGELVRAAADLMRPMAARRGMEIEVEAPPAGELSAEVDARALGRAVVNLIDNAIKYAPRGTPVRVMAEATRKGGMRIAVTDEGAPIPAFERERIFGKFYRSGSELTRETEGVGIGLSLVRHIANAHGGRAFVESGPAGNRFVLETHGKD